MAGVGCWLVSYPADVLKTRWQADGVEGKPLFTSVRQCYQHTAADARSSPAASSAKGEGGGRAGAAGGNAEITVEMKQLQRNLVEKDTYKTPKWCKAPKPPSKKTLMIKAFSGASASGRRQL